MTKAQKAAYAREYRKNHPEYREYMRNYLREWGRRNASQKRVEGKRYSRTLAGQYRQVTSRAKSHNIPITLTFEEFCSIRQGNCSYCSGELPETGSGLDRKNNNEGYTKENCIPCCRACNSIKSKYLTFDEMRVVMTALLELRKTRRK